MKNKIIIFRTNHLNQIEYFTDINFVWSAQFNKYVPLYHYSYNRSFARTFKNAELAKNYFAEFDFPEGVKVAEVQSIINNNIDDETDDFGQHFNSSIE